ncbi:MAG TPA: dolichyl-phosphate beta-D-mannosyltransferase [Bacteroidetes bacterium]|nr:dolichyl-phosphate beta-D-mannosyltransferase [Bacteroidota bacterium]
MSRALVIIPTYNEAPNAEKIITEVLHQSEIIDVLIVEDNSPDGTAAIVKKMMETNPRIHILERERKLGLGTAYVAGFKYAIKNKYDFIFEMDADFSHNPKEIPIILSKMEECDVLIGSRYIKGVNVVNWPMKRLILSYSANIYTRIITGMPIHDATAGFKCYKRKVLESIDLDSIRSNGYAFQIETNFLAWKKGFKLLEMPIVFVDRRVGVSKMNKKIVYEAAFMVWKLKARSIFNKL